MKKAIKLTFTFAVFAIISLFAMTAHASDTVKSSIVQTYNGKTYTCAKYRVSGKIEDSSVYSLAGSIKNRGMVNSFEIYYDKIYYNTSYEGSDNVVGYIYRCNLDGSNNELIANDADAFADFYLSDGCIYYQVLYDYDNAYGRYLNGGVMMINLNNGWYGKIITDWDAGLVNVLDDKIFYSVSNGYHLMTSRGRYIGANSSSDIEVYADTVVGAAGYKGEYGAIYKYNWNKNSQWICNVPRSITGAMAVYYQYPVVVNVSGGYIYYVIGFTPNYSYNYASPNQALFRVPVSGGNSTLVAKWFVS